MDRTILFGLVLLLALAVLSRAPGTPVLAQTPVAATPTTAGVTPAPTAEVKLPDDLQTPVSLFTRLVGQMGWPLAALLAVLALVFVLLWRGVSGGVVKWVEEWTKRRLDAFPHRPADLAEGERGYLQRGLLKEYETIYLVTLGESEADQKVDLRRVYIPLGGRGRQTNDRRAQAAKGEDTRLRRSLTLDPEGDGEPDGPTGEDDTLCLTEFIERLPRVIIQGRAGSGKSTFLKYAAMSLAQARLGEKPAGEEDWQPRFDPLPLPIYFSLASFATWLKENKTAESDLIPELAPDVLLDFLVHRLEHDKLTRDFLCQRLDAGRCTIFLDSLDEVAADQRPLVLSLVEAFVRRYGSAIPSSAPRPGAGRLPANVENRFVVASRPEALVHLDPLADFTVIDIQPLDAEQVQQFVPRFYHELLDHRPDGAAEADSSARTLLDAIPQKAGLQELTETPLLLTLVALIHLRAGLPDSRHDLYRRCVELLLMDWEKTKARTSRPGGLAVPPGVPRELKDRIERLEPVAYELLRRGTDRAPVADWIRIITEALARPATDDEAQRIHEFLEWAVERSALLEKPGAAEDVYSFAYHKSFREYLAARYLAYPTRLPVARSLVGNADWFETLRLLASALSSADRLAFLRDALQDPTAYGALLVAECLIEIRDPGLDEDLRQPTRERLAAVMVDLGQAVVNRARAGRLLARLGDERPGVSLKDGLPDIAWCPIPAGEFLMGSDKRLDPEAYDDEVWTESEPRRRLFLPAFSISRYPITVAQFRPFVEGDGYHNDAYWTDAGWAWKGDRVAPEYWDDATWKLENHPVAGVSWYEAQAYCEWLCRELGLHVRLPSEAEWEKAARGTDGRVYPWGDAFDANRCNSDESGIRLTSAVGLFPLPDGPWGADGPLDMSGNVWEWCRTWWTESYATSDWGNDNLDGGAPRCVRGGSWNVNQGYARCACRDGDYPYRRGRPSWVSGGSFASHP